MEQGSFMWPSHPSRQWTRKQREALSNKTEPPGRALWREPLRFSTAPHLSLMNQPPGFSAQSRWRQGGDERHGHRGCWLTRALSKGPLTAVEPSSLLSYSWAARIQGDKVTFSQTYSLAVWTWGSETPSGLSSPCHFASFAQLPIYKWIVSGFLLIYTENNMYFLEMSQINFYYILINLLNTQDLTAE